MTGAGYYCTLVPMNGTALYFPHQTEPCGYCGTDVPVTDDECYWCHEPQSREDD